MILTHPLCLFQHCFAHMTCYQAGTFFVWMNIIGEEFVLVGCRERKLLIIFSYLGWVFGRLVIWEAFNSPSWRGG